MIKYRIIAVDKIKEMFNERMFNKITLDGEPINETFYKIKTSDGEFYTVLDVNRRTNTILTNELKEVAPGVCYKIDNGFLYQYRVD